MIDILGTGRIGGALANGGVMIGRSTPATATEGPAFQATRLGPQRAAEPEPDRYAALAAHPGRPLLIATRNDDLEGAVRRVPQERRNDLVFVQNGMLRPWLDEQGLGGATRGVLLFAVAARGDKPISGGESVFCGPQAEAMAACLVGHGLAAAAVAEDRFADVELEKVLWICAFGAIGSATGLAVGDIVRRHMDDIAAIAGELAPLARTVIPSRLDTATLVERMKAYALGVPAWKPAVREYSWRNGWFEEAAYEAGVRTPHHDRWLAYAQR